MPRPLALAALLLLAASPAGAQATRPAITYLAWSDQHVTKEGDARFLAPAVAAMNGIAGRDWLAEVGGVVEAPAFVLGCGDATDWPTPAAVEAYDAAASRLRYERFDLVGNHDEGREPSDPRRTDRWAAAAANGMLAGAVVYVIATLWRPRALAARWRRIVVAALVATLTLAAVRLAGQWRDDAMKRYVASRQGATRYTFDRGGVRFVCLFSEYNPRQRLTDEALAFLRTTLAATPRGQPIVVATHYCLDAISNKDDFVDALGDANVVLILGGHHHRASDKTYRGRRFVQVPSPRYNGQFTVVRIVGDEVTAAPFDFRAGRWATPAGPAR